VKEASTLEKFLLPGVIGFFLFMLAIGGFVFFYTLMQVSPDERAKQVAGMILSLLALLCGPVSLWLLARKESK